MEMNRIYCGDCLEVLKTIPENTFDCCVTSPPYFGLRDYGSNGQIGLENSPEDYIGKLVSVFEEVRRTLKPDGTLWLNIGDSYAGSRKGAMVYPENAKAYKQGSNRGSVDSPACLLPLPQGYKPKDLIGIPWMLAFALRSAGWYLRQDIIWEKPNPMPESVRDRCTKCHEYIFLLSKSKRYFFDAEAIAEPVADSTVSRMKQDISKQAGSSWPGYDKPVKAKAPRYGGKKYTENPDVFNRTKSGNAYELRDRRNKRDVWRVTTRAFKGAHFATFPEELISPCILAGSRRGGCILDPFIGSGTTGVVSRKNGRNFVGIELNPEYAKMAEMRIFNEGENLFG